jgi:hypothetical protein
MKTENANGASDEQIWSLALSSQKILRDSQKLTFQTDRYRFRKISTAVICFGCAGESSGNARVVSRRNPHTTRPIFGVGTLRDPASHCDRGGSQGPAMEP